MVITAAAPALPAEVVKALGSFLDARRTGAFVLDVKDGRILGWRVQEEGRVKIPRYPMA